MNLSAQLFVNKNEEHKSINVSFHGRSKKGILSQVWLRDNPDKVWLKEKVDQVSLNLLRSYTICPKNMKKKLSNTFDAAKWSWASLIISIV